jgi:5-methylcytosine-specific restriction endonuclease McrA
MKKKPKKPKLVPIPKIHKKLYTLSSLVCRTKAQFKCEVCGAEGKVDAHHISPRTCKVNSPLKFDTRNLIALCASKHHKFGVESIHSNPIFVFDWILKNRKDDYDYILNNLNVEVNLKDRLVLKEIEDKLLKELEQANSEL